MILCILYLDFMITNKLYPKFLVMLKSFKVLFDTELACTHYLQVF